MKKQSIFPTCLAIAVTALLIPSPAFADSEDSVVTAQQHDIRRETVSYRDLNLTSPVGIYKLRRRVNSVAFGLCTDKDAVYVLSTTDETRCVRRAVEGAEPQIARAVARANNADLASLGAGTITFAMRR